jgi:exopolysaccharide production protein ExoZ
MSRTNKIESIQMLRAVAALGVVVFHSVHQLTSRGGPAIQSADLGAAGVDLFFVVSGFIMWVTALGPGMSPQRFAAKRIQRIVPLYWLMTALVLAVAVLAPGAMHNASHDPWHIAASFAFVPWPHPAMPGRLWPVLVPGWSLNYEMFFYVLVGCSLLLRRPLRLPVISGVLCAFVLAGVLLQPGGGAGFYANPIVLEFVLGLLIGRAFDSGHRTRSLDYAACLLGLGTFAVAGQHATEANRLLTWGLPLALAAYGAINISPPRASRIVRGLGILGDASYSVYLTQFLVLPAAAAACARALPDLHSPLACTFFVVGTSSVAVLIGVASYYWVEKPILRASTGLLSRNQRLRSTVAQW